MSLNIFTAGDEFDAGPDAALVEHWAAYGAMLPQEDAPAEPVVLIDIEAIVLGFDDDRAKARLLFTEKAAHELLHGIENSLVLLANLRKNQGK